MGNIQASWVVFRTFVGSHSVVALPVWRHYDFCRVQTRWWYIIITSAFFNLKKRFTSSKTTVSSLTLSLWCISVICTTEINLFKIPLLYFPCNKELSLLFCDKPLPIRIWYIGLWNSGHIRKPEATYPAIALQALEAGIVGKARAFERTIMSRRSHENSIDEKRRIRNERNKRKRLSRIM